MVYVCLILIGAFFPPSYRWACGNIVWGYSPAEATQVSAIASFHHPKGYAWGYIRLVSGDFHCIHYSNDYVWCYSCLVSWGLQRIRHSKSSNLDLHSLGERGFSVYLRVTSRVREFLCIILLSCIYLSVLIEEEHWVVWIYSVKCFYLCITILFLSPATTDIQRWIIRGDILGSQSSSSWLQ